MAFDIVETALGFIAEYGLIAIFILLVLDAALLLPVFPGEIVLIIAVATYVDSPGDLLFLIGLTTAASMVGSLLLYGVVRGGGRRLVERYPRLFMMPRRRRERLEQSFQKPLGQSLVLFLRLIPFTRIIVNIPAGLAKMPLARFIVLSTLGMLAYHTAFLWFAFEANRPGSPIAAQQEQLHNAYASPAWDFVQTNAIITGAALVLLGIVLSVRASLRIYKDPEEPSGSLLGSLTTLLLFWGGIALAAATYMDPQAVYSLARVGGVDVPTLAQAIDLGPVRLLFGLAILAVLAGLLLVQMRRSAMKRHRAHKAKPMPSDARRGGWPRAHPSRAKDPVGASAPGTRPGLRPPRRAPADTPKGPPPPARSSPAAGLPGEAWPRPQRVPRTFELLAPAAAADEREEASARRSSGRPPGRPRAPPRQ